MHLRAGTLLQGGKYRIEKMLGQGSFGITYLADHTLLDRRICIKEFFMKELNSRVPGGRLRGMTDGSLSQDYARKFKREAKNLSRLDHPNIVRVTDSFSENNTFYYVMDYIDGVNINEYIHNGSIAEKDAVDIILHVAEALKYMHEQKHMLHLDLKPGNIMRRHSDGQIFLIDFGLSKHFNSNGQPETSTTIGMGTPGYAPVEQNNQISDGEFRPTIDIYALGATLFKLLTGETPPLASEIVSNETLLADKMKEHFICDDIIKLVVKSMQPNVNKRLQSVATFINLLKKVDISAKYEPMDAEEDDEVVVVSVVDDDGPYVDDSSDEARFERAMSDYHNALYTKSVGVFRELASKNFAPAMYRLGICYYWAEGVDRNKLKIFDYQICKDWLKKAADAGCADAIYFLATYLLTNASVQGYVSAEAQQQKEKLELEKAVKGNSNLARIALGRKLLSNEKKKIDGQVYLKSAVSQIQMKLHPSREEVHWVGACYVEGYGVDKNVEKGVEWLTRAAAMNDPEAQYRLGMLYLSGTGVKRDAKKAIELLNKAARKGLNEAVTEIGNCYRTGTGMPVDYNQALNYYRKAADEGFGEGMVGVARMYIDGLGVERNYKEAIKWLRNAMEKTHCVSASYYLGVVFENGGDGIAPNQYKARELYKKAADKDYAPAQLAYGRLLMKMGDDSMRKEAMEYLRKASNAGEASATQYLDKLNHKHHDPKADKHENIESPDSFYDGTITVADDNSTLKKVVKVLAIIFIALCIIGGIMAVAISSDY